MIRNEGNDSKGRSNFRGGSLLAQAAQFLARVYAMGANAQVVDILDLARNRTRSLALYSKDRKLGEKYIRHTCAPALDGLINALNHSYEVALNRDELLILHRPEDLLGAEAWARAEARIRLETHAQLNRFLVCGLLDQHDKLRWCVLLARNGDGFDESFIREAVPIATAVLVRAAQCSHCSAIIEALCDSTDDLVGVLSVRKSCGAKWEHQTRGLRDLASSREADLADAALQALNASLRDEFLWNGPDGRLYRVQATPHAETGEARVIAVRLAPAAPQQPSLVDEQRMEGFGLTNREKEVLVLVGRGLAAKEVARELKISFHTARVHIRNLLRKLGVSSRIEALNRVRDGDAGVTAPTSPSKRSGERALESDAT